MCCRNFCGLTGAGGDGHAIAPSEYRRVLSGFRRWRYFSNCSIGMETIPTCFKYHRNKLYFGTVEGQLNVIDFGFHNAASSLSTGENGRIFSIDVKEDILVAGCDDGSIRFYNPEDSAGGGRSGGSSLTITNSPLVFIRLLSFPQATGGARILCWSREGDCYLVSPHRNINLIGRLDPVWSWSED